MGCAGSKEEEEKPAPKQQQQPARSSGAPPPLSPEEVERRRKEAEEAKRWEGIARESNPPPFPKPQLGANASEQEYKQFMVRKYEYEAWENSIILISRKMRKEAQEKESQNLNDIY